MLTVIRIFRTIITFVALLEVIFILFSTTGITHRMLIFLSEHKKAQIAFGIILLLGYAFAVMGQLGF